MISYNNSDVVQCLRQYDMFANSLNLIRSTDERNMIVKQLTKLEEKIITLTNAEYEEEYYELMGKECGLLEEEKNRIAALIELINQRLSYVEKRCNNHYQLTGESIDVNDVLGASELDELENKLKIIDKYSENVRQEALLEEDIKSLTSKISLASEKIDINKSLNLELETTFKKILNDAFSKLGLYELLDNRNNIEYDYYETEKLLTLAQLNYETAKNSHLDILADCQEMLNDVSKDYTKYKDQINILKLIDIYENDVNDYNELLAKRREVNDILKGIKNEELLGLISDTVSKQYNTIMMEEQDINTFNDLALEKERKLETLSEIRDENNSEEFQSVLKVLIENEKKKQEKLLEEQRKIEEEEKKRRQEIERKKQEEILKKQKIIEEARKKEIEKRTKKLLEEQQNSVLQGRKKDNNVSFETIKDVSLENEQNDEHEEIVQEKPVMSREERNHKMKLNDLNNKDDDNEEQELKLKNDEFLFKNKVDIEKELFEEFNNKNVNTITHHDDNDDVVVSKNEDKDDDSDNDLNNISLFGDKVEEEDKGNSLLNKIENKMSNNSFPDMSIDEYMKNFDEDKLEKSDTLSDFGDEFPTIPM